MSLIHQMLQDLEKREPNPLANSSPSSPYVQMGNVSGDSDFSGPRYVKSHASLKKIALFLLCCMLLLAVALFWKYQVRPLTSPESVAVNVQASPAVSLTSNVNTSTASNASNVTSDSHVAVIHPDSPVQIEQTSLSFQLKMMNELQRMPEDSVKSQEDKRSHKQYQEQESHGLEMAIKDKNLKDKNLKYQPEKNKSQENPSYERNQTQTQANQPISDKNAAIPSPNERASHPSANSSESVRTSVNANGRLTVTNVPDTPIAATPIIKEISSAQKAESAYRQASQHYQQARYIEAISQLEQALKVDARHSSARQMLATIYLEQNRLDDAVHELRTGLAADYQQTQLAMMLARLLVERAKVSDAVDVLQKTLPSAENRPEYLAFYAALLQKQQRHKEAITYYQQALSKHRGNGAWWMGLGISLQAEGAKPQAIEAFAQAKMQAGLSNEVQAFIDQRLQQLR